MLDRKVVSNLPLGDRVCPATFDSTGSYRHQRREEQAHILLYILEEDDLR